MILPPYNEAAKMKIQDVFHPLALPETQRVYVDCVSGFGAGLAAVFAGHPLDTLRVRLQAGWASQGGGLLHAAVLTVKEQGFVGFYRGVGPPMATSGAITALTFSLYEAFNRMIQTRWYPESEQVPLTTILASGTASGVLISSLTTPIHRIKILQQMMRGKRSPPFWEVARFCYQHGGMSELYKKSLGLQMICEGIGRASYFFTYEYVKRVLSDAEGLHVWYVPLVAGACSGVAAWTAVYPADVLKARIQAQPVGETLFHGLKDVAHFVYRSEGLPGFFRGYSVATFRAIITATITLPTFEALRDMLNSMLRDERQLH